MPSGRTRIRPRSPNGIRSMETQSITTRFPIDLLTVIDHWRSRQEIPPNRTGAMIYLLRIALLAEGLSEAKEG